MSLTDKIQENITQIPFEGQEIDVKGIEDLIKGQLKGMITFAHNFERNNKGYYYKDGKQYSKDEIVEKFLKFQK